jgi:translation initiation factor IF-1
MVKNSTGGNKAKGFARKNLTKRDTALRVADEEGEVYAQAVKVMGGSIASAIDINGNPLRAHIRGKFRGRGKRDNFIAPGTWLLVGLHTWEADKSTKTTEIRNCDILEVYNDNDKNRLKTTVTSVDWSRFVANDTKTLGDDKNGDDAGGIIFADEDTQEYENLIASHMSNGASSTIIMDDGEEIDVDDI